MKPLVRRRNGFTLIESLISISIAAVFMGSMLSVWTFSTKNFKEESVKTELRYSIETALERIKHDVRLTDGNNILFYPLGSSPYTAVSMPGASTDANGFYTFGSTITWNRTIVYHTYDNSGTMELRRTVFDAYNSSAASRQSQLDNVVASGGDAAAATTVLFSGTAVNFEVVPASPSFDGYNSTLSLSTLTSFGSALLTPGNHQLRFTVSDKNASSSGYKMGFDYFVAAPSGENGQEAEALPVSASSGKSSITEDMTAYPAAGSWKGDHQMEYQSSAPADYLQYQVYNDQWIESNFENMTHSNTEVTDDNPELTVASRENQSLLPSWKAETQTDSTEADNASAVNDLTIRNIVSSGSIAKGGRLIRFKFRSATTGNLRVTAAYFGVRSAATYNFSGAPTQLTFGNGTVVEGAADGVGAVGVSGITDIDIPVGEHAWTNWVEIPIAYPATSDYLISFSVHTSAAKGNETYWKPAGAGPTMSYFETGANASGTWLPVDLGLGSDDAIHAVEEMSTWEHSGVSISQIYDTKMTSPSFGQLSWLTNGSGSYSLKVRSSANAQMIGAPDWSAVSAYTTSPAAMSVASNQYVQFQATLTTASPYTPYPEIDNVTIQWPGQTTLVEFSGVYTKRPNYGMFTVQLDGNSLYNALDVSISGTKNYQGLDYDTTMSASIRAKNTGK